MACQNLLQVIALVLGLVGLPLLAEASRNGRLDCTNTFGGASLSTIENICAEVTDDKMFQGSKASLRPITTLETIETCACALINHELAWASLMTHENEILFLSIKQLVDQWDKQAGRKTLEGKPVRATNPLFQGPDGDRRYYWDRLDDILRDANGDNDDEDISVAIRENFSKMYYEPETFKTKYDSPRLMQSQKLRSIVSDACKSVLGKFAAQFLKYFDRLSRLSENDRLFFSLTAYNEDLYKLRLNTKTCLYLMEKGQLTA